MAHIVLSDISKAFEGKLVLGGINLEVRFGEFLTLVGPSGCGKSTLLRIIAGLEPQTTGSVEINGAIVDQVRPADRDLAMVFQSYALYPHLTVAQNIALPLTMREMTGVQRLPIVGPLLPGTGAVRRRIADRAAEIASSLGLRDFLHRKPGQLSGGQRQRVALARAMVREPHAFLMDEPLSNLDANMRAQMRCEIAELHRRLGVTFIYVTHDQAEAMTLSSRVVVMLDGRIEQIGAPREIYEDPATLRVARFFGEPAINCIGGYVNEDGSVQAGELVVAAGLDLPQGTPVTVAIRSENMAVAPTGADGFAATLVQVEYLGANLVIHGRLDDGTALIARADRDMIGLTPGRPLRLRPAEGGCLIFDAAGARLKTQSEAVPLIRRCVPT